MAGHCDGAANVIHALSLVIPAFNEEAVIRHAIAEAAAALERLGLDHEILVVDDGSTDNTAALVAQARETFPQVRLLRHAQNRGYSAALRTGFEAARFDQVAFTDADCQFDLSDLASLLPLTKRFPLVAGYRQERQDPALRRFISWGYNLVVRTLLGTRVRDCDCALKVFRRDALVNLLPETGGFFVNTEMLTRARQLDYAVAEVGVRHRPRLGGASKVSLGDIPRTLRTLLPFWWSRVLFPMSAHGSVNTAAPGPRRPMALFRLVLLLLMAGLLFFARLRCPLLEPEEARYAEIPRQMLEEDRFLVPVLHGEAYLQKPPLLYWIVMSCYGLFGAHDWAARLVPCSAGFLIVLITYLWGRRLAGERAGFTGAVILALSARFIYFGRMLTFESLLCLWVVSALATAHVAMHRGKMRWRWWVLSAVCSGLGMLTKGPVALVLVAMPVLAFRMLDQRSPRPGLRGWLIYATVAVGVACPWYLAVAARDPVFPGSFFWTHNVVRYFAPFDHAKPVWFYLPGLLLGMMPWTLLLPAFVMFLGRRKAALAMLRSSALGFFLLAALGCLVFFSLSGCKRAGYILPVFPPLALALGCYVAAVLPTAQPWIMWRGWQWSARLRWGLYGGITFGLLFMGVYQLLPGYARKFSLRGQVRRHFDLAKNPQLPVACYPHRWDSVSFYLQRGDVHVYTPAGRQQLFADLEAHKGTLVFLKSDGSSGRVCSNLLRRLPSCLEFVPQGRRGTVTAGIVRHRSGSTDLPLAEQAAHKGP